jgi:inorganic pyrophosphatase
MYSPVNEVSPGNNVPDEINVFIEIGAHSSPVKYELNKDANILEVDRFLSTPMTYPCNYGFIPKTLGDDGDPVDVLVLSPFPVQPGAIIRCRPVGMLEMADEAGNDEKILAVPITKLTTYYTHVDEYSDLNEDDLKKIEHFFSRYKDLESGKWVKIKGWAGLEKTKQLIVRALQGAPNVK